MIETPIEDLRNHLAIVLASLKSKRSKSLFQVEADLKQIVNSEEGGRFGGLGLSDSKLTRLSKQQIFTFANNAGYADIFQIYLGQLELLTENETLDKFVNRVKVEPIIWQQVKNRKLRKLKAATDPYFLSLNEDAQLESCLGKYSGYALGADRIWLTRAKSSKQPSEESADMFVRFDLEISKTQIGKGSTSQFQFSATRSGAQNVNSGVRGICSALKQDIYMIAAKETAYIQFYQLRQIQSGLLVGLQSFSFANAFGGRKVVLSKKTLGDATLKRVFRSRFGFSVKPDIELDIFGY
jgi:hypothetical protein